MGDFSEQMPIKKDDLHPVHLHIIGGFPFDQSITIEETDAPFQEIVSLVMQAINNETPTVGDIALKISEIYPIDHRATTAVRNIRATSEKPLPLSTYFQPGEDYPYAAVCVHKTLLAQAVASQYGLNPTIADFSFSGQIKNGENDNKSGMHAALVYIDKNGQKRIADAHKGIDSTYEEYWENFEGVQIFMQDTTVFAPVS